MAIGTGPPLTKIPGSTHMFLMTKFYFSFKTPSERQMVWILIMSKIYIVRPGLGTNWLAKAPTSFFF